MTIVLFGGSGMVGRNIQDLAAMRGVEILAPTRAEVDVLSAHAVQAYLKRVQPEAVIHAAGRVGGIQANMREPVRFLVDNWDMGRNIVLAAREVGVRKLINLGSSCMYPRNSPHALREEDILSGTLDSTNEGYALAKCSVARLCQYIGVEDSRFQYKTLVPCNLYGKYDAFDPARSHMAAAVIAKIHQAKMTGANVVDIWGDGTARREFLYAEDCAEAVLKATVDYETLPSVLNIGLGTDYTIDEYYTLTAEVIGYTGSFSHNLDKPAGMQRKLVSIERAIHWGWQPKTSLRDGIRQTYAYYQEHYCHDNLSIGQL
jgi:GDP-L-fucose synthase